MNPLIKSLSVLALGGILAGTAIAGPGDAHPGFAYQAMKQQQRETVQIALFRESVDERTYRVEKKRIPDTSQRTYTERNAQVVGRMAPKW